MSIDDEIAVGDKVYIKREEDRWGYVDRVIAGDGAVISVREETPGKYKGKAYWWARSEVTTHPIKRWWMEGC